MDWVPWIGGFGGALLGVVTAFFILRWHFPLPKLLPLSDEDELAYQIRTGTRGLTPGAPRGLTPGPSRRRTRKAS